MSRSPEICILKTDGINCEEEMANAFTVAGGSPDIVHINQLRSGEKKLVNYAALSLPGGFSYGDDIRSGVVLGTELTAYLGDELHAFVDAKKPILGVCNGFQVLAQTGLLPNRSLGEQTITLARNDIGRFVCKWVDLDVEDSICKFTPTKDFEEIISMQIAHGEGRFSTKDSQLLELIYGKQIVFSYLDNPNGSLASIAGVCDKTGLILGMMPHPERSTAAFHPDRKRTDAARRASAIIFNNIVNYAKES